MKMGRPTIEPDKRKQVISTLRTSEAERQDMDKAAAVKGASFSSWARETLSQEARRILDQAAR